MEESEHCTVHKYCFKNILPPSVPCPEIKAKGENTGKRIKNSQQLTLNFVEKQKTAITFLILFTKFEIHS